MIDLNTPSTISLNLEGIRRNYFKNPNFQVIQSTASGTLANSLALPTASLGYLGETEWCLAASGGTPAYAFSSANESVTFTGASGTTAIYLLQRLESKDVTTLANKLAIVTLSADISNSLLTSVIWEAYRPTTTADTHGTIASPTQTLIASGAWTVDSTLRRYSATFTLPALATNGLEVRLRVGAQTSGTWVVSRLQLEEGNVASTFNCDEYASELLKCKRYYEFTKRGIDGYGGAGSGVGYYFGFEVEKFAVPVLSIASTNATNISSNTVQNATKKEAQIYGVATATGGYIWQANITLFSHIP